MLFSHPADFTPVCTTELGRVAALQDEWAARGVKVINVSVDCVESHRALTGGIEPASATPRACGPCSSSTRPTRCDDIEEVTPYLRFTSAVAEAPVSA